MQPKSNHETLFQPAKIDTSSTPNSFRSDSISQKPLFKHIQKHLFLIAYNNSKDQIPPQQIMVLQQPHKKIKLSNQTQEITKMLHNVGLQSTQTEQLFLTKINPAQKQQIQKYIKQTVSRAETFSNQDRQQRRKLVFDSSSARTRQMDRASQEVIAKRTIRIVKLDSLTSNHSAKGVIQLGGRTMEYEDLNINDQTHNYYALTRRKVKTDQPYPQITIHQSLLAPIDFDNQQSMQEEQNDDDFDSNGSDNPNYDYPEEEYSSKSSEDIIHQNRSEQGEYYQEEDECQDQQQLYRRYLRRCRNKQQQIEGEYQYEEYD